MSVLSLEDSMIPSSEVEAAEGVQAGGIIPVVS